VGLAKQLRSRGDRDRHGQEWAEKESSPSSSLCGDGSRQCSWSAKNASGEVSDAETRQEKVNLAARMGLVQWAFGRPSAGAVGRCCNGVHEEVCGLYRCNLQLPFGLVGPRFRTERECKPPPGGAEPFAFCSCSASGWTRSAGKTCSWLGSPLSGSFRAESLRAHSARPAFQAVSTW